MALVIGNANYTHASKLDNPLNDAEDMTLALRNLGFEVFTGRDSSRESMESLLLEFEAAVLDSKVALFFFAGHAFQIGERNYLIPTDLSPGSPEAILDESVPLDSVIRVLERAPGLRFVFLDACRDNPMGLTRRGADEGLARVGTSADFLISYATQPGAVAWDGDGRNGTFTEALLNHILTPGQTMAELMISVRRDVIAATGGQQIPWESSSLTRSFKLDDGPRAASEETTLYQIAAKAQEPTLMSFYLRRYPQGAHVADATDFLISARSTTPDAGLENVGTDGDGVDGEELWRLALRTRQRQLVEYYVERYPDGAHIGEARRMLESLPGLAELGPGRQCELLATHPKDATGTTGGTSFSDLRERAAEAVSFCSTAVENFPQQPRFVALLARATLAAGRGGEAIELYQQAARRGDLRAKVSLGLLYEIGNGLPKNETRAVELYRQAAEGGSTDGMINLAVALFEGRIVAQDRRRAIALFRQASAIGAAQATYNLGTLAQRGDVGNIDEAFEYFLRAAREGEPRGYRAAAILLDKGFGVQLDFGRAASLVLRGAAEDNGEIIDGFRNRDFAWSPRTIRAVQTRLQEAGFYRGAIDGVVGPNFIAALEDWRSGGFDVAVLEE